MIAKQTNLKDFIKESRFFKIPDFQRPYAWKKVQGISFLESISDTITNSKHHYFGSVVFFEENKTRVVIDGQQRLTTTLLFIMAIYHTLLDDSRRSWKYTAEEIGKEFLYNEEDGELKVILRAATSDRETFNRLLRQKTLPIDERSKLFYMYQLFVEKIKSIDRIDPFIETLDCIDMISILLTPEDDNPQIIFENINATGEPLTVGDKIRNYALMLNSEKARNTVYNDYWLKIEKSLARDTGSAGFGKDPISTFFRTFLVTKSSDKLVNDKNTYEKFKEYYCNKTTDQSIEQLHEVWSEVVSVLESYIYLNWKEDITIDKKLRVFDDDLEDKNNNYTHRTIVGYLTFFIQLLEYYKQGELTRNDFRNLIAVVRKQKIRDEIGGPGSLKLTNNTAASAYRCYKEYKMNSMYDAYLWYMEGGSDPSNNKNITDEEIEFAITNKDVPDKFAEFLLREIEIANNNSIECFDKKIAHIMPKAIYGFRLDDVWKEELGDDWEKINQRFYNKLANIALVDYPPTTNKKMSFKENLERYDGIGGSEMYSTKWICDNCERWDLEALKNRTIWLREELVKLYELPKPILSQEIIYKFGESQIRYDRTTSNYLLD